MSVVWREIVSHPATVRPSFSDDQLVRACLDGSEDAWVTLIDRYKNLIYSIPVRAGLSRDDASDVFQAVCLELFSELGNLKNTTCLRSWLITVAVSKLSRFSRHRQRHPVEALLHDTRVVDTAPTPDVSLEQLERDQRIRDAVASLPQRCRDLVTLLFYQHPAPPYADVARHLGIAVGSVGFIRSRCLDKLARALERAGL